MLRHPHRYPFACLAAFSALAFWLSSAAVLSQDDDFTPPALPTEGENLPVPPDLSRLQADLEEAVGDQFAMPEAAFQIFPESVRQDIQKYVTEVVALLATNQEEGLKKYLADNSAKVAVIFDQLGLKDVSADALLAEAQAPADIVGDDTILFPNEYRNYESYLASLSELTEQERGYLENSHRVASAFRLELAEAGENDERIQSALEKYRQQLEAINEQYAEHFRERFLESLDRADAAGGRPDIDR